MVIRAAYKAHLETELAITSAYLPPTRTLDDQWSRMVWAASDQAIRNPDTGLDRKTLAMVGRASVAVPEGFVRLLFCLVFGIPDRLDCAGDTSEATEACQTSTTKP